MGQAAIPAAAVNVSWAALSAGFQHTCGVAAADKRLTCWGSNLAGEASVPEPKDAGLALPGAPTVRPGPRPKTSPRRRTREE